MLAACLALLAVPAAAGAHEAVAPASATLAVTGEPRPDTLAIGGALATTAACRAGREVHVFARYWEWTHRHVWGPGQWRSAGRTRTADDGSFAGAVQKQNLWSVKAVIPIRSTEARDHHHACGRAVAAFRLEQD